MQLRDYSFVERSPGHPRFRQNNISTTVRVVFLILLFLFSLNAFASDCENWFLKSGIDPGSETCETSCSIFSTDMGTFNCPGECEKLCRTYFNPELYDSRTLTPSEVALVAKYPLEAGKVWVAKNKALKSTKRLFGRQVRISVKPTGDFGAFRPVIGA